MKRLLTIALAILFCGHQAVEAQLFEAGVRGGLNVTTLAGIDNTTPRFGPYVGLTTQLNLSDYFGLGLEATFSEQGARTLPDDNGVTTDYRYNYLNIPLLARISIPAGASAFTFVLGPQMGLFMEGEHSFVAPSILTEGTVSGSEMLNNEDFHPMDWSVVVGLSWRYGKVAIDLRYALGITQTHDGISNTMADYYYVSVPDNRNSVAQIGASIYF